MALDKQTFNDVNDIRDHFYQSCDVVLKNSTFSHYYVIE